MVTLSGLSLVILTLLIVALVVKPLHRSGFPEFWFPDLWRWQGTVGRGTYAMVGLTGFAIKHNIDRIVATAIFDRPFTIFNYWMPDLDPRLLATLFVIALPFIWVGVGMTLRRLRSVQLPLWLVFLFFVPVLNVVFFALLSVMPERSRIAADVTSPGVLAPMIPTGALGSAGLAVAVTAVIGAAASYIGVQALGSYGWGVFVALPFCLGLGSVLIYAYRQPRSLKSCLAVSVIAIGVVSLALLAFAIEGVLCIVMAIPVALPLACLGAIIGFLIQRQGLASTEAPSMMLLLIVLPVSVMGIEKVSTPEAPRIAVTTTIRIEASAGTVWKNLIAFSDLPDPNDLLFRFGVSHPIRATIEGEGIGAVRQCLFSTGTFVERVTAWEPGRRFAFSVESGPEVMREFSPYDIHPRHLNGYLVSESAEFRLISNPDGSTTLEGVSLYRNAMWPSRYWQLWSDGIIHNVHRRVFEHIKTLSER